MIRQWERNESLQPAESFCRSDEATLSSGWNRLWVEANSVDER